MQVDNSVIDLMTIYNCAEYKKHAHLKINHA